MIPLFGFVCYNHVTPNLILKFFNYWFLIQSGKNQFPDLPVNHSNYNNDSGSHHDKQNSKHAKKVAAIEESVQQTFLRNMTISDEFMKWCHEQLKDFHAERSLPHLSEQYLYFK